MLKEKEKYSQYKEKQTYSILKYFILLYSFVALSDLLTFRFLRCNEEKKNHKLQLHTWEIKENLFDLI